jgi:hypothetical protein
MRFGLSYTRTDETTLWNVPIPQFVAALTLGLAIILASVLMRWPGPITPEYVQRVWGQHGDPRKRRRRDSGGEPPSETTTAAV